MIWQVLVAAAMWWSSAPAGCPVREAPAPAPKSGTIVPQSHWAYQALADLAGAGWVIPSGAARNGGSLTREAFTQITAQLVTAAAARDQAPAAVPMPQRILVARLAAEFPPTGAAAAAAAQIPGLHPEEAPSPDGKRLVRFVPTPSGAEIVVVEKATQKPTPIAVVGYNYGPVWSDDGDEVAWLSFAAGRTEVWVHSMLIDNEHLAGSALADGWGTLTAVKDGFTLHLPDRPDRLVRIPALLEPENGARPEEPEPPTPGQAK
jgi:WD40 repeat protein